MSWLAADVGFPGDARGKEPACQCRRHKRREFNLWVGKIAQKKKWQPNPVFLSGKSHKPRGLAGYSPWGHKRVGHNLAANQQLDATTRYLEMLKYSKLTIPNIGKDIE